MDQLGTYAKLIKTYLAHYAELLQSSSLKTTTPDLTINLALDDEHGQYLLVQSGWQGKRYVRHIILHLAIRQDKIWIEEDLTEEGIATWLIQQGVPRQAIVLGFQPPQNRVETALALGL